MKKTVLFLVLAILIAVLLSGCGDSDSHGNIHPEKVMDRVYDLGTCRDLDFTSINQVISETLDGWENNVDIQFVPSGCSTIVKTLANGETIIGRNMDYMISKYPVYTGKIDNPGQYKCAFVTAVNAYVPTCPKVERRGLTEEQYSVIPFLATDVMNEEGLYVEHNMRSDETDEHWNSLMACGGTNPDADVRLSVTSLPAYLCLNCKNVDEAVELAGSLDIYTLNFMGICCSSGFMLSDAEGNCGVLEVAGGKVSFLKDQNCQTNFYLTPEVAEMSRFGAGLGRYDYLMDNIDGVESEEDMAQLMTGIYYSGRYAYPWEPSQVDWRTESTADGTRFTVDYVLSEDNKKKMDFRATLVGFYYDIIPRKLKETMSVVFWETIYTDVANCSNRTMTLSVYENPEETIVLTAK